MWAQYLIFLRTDISRRLDARFIPRSLQEGNGLRTNHWGPVIGRQVLFI